MEFSLQKLLIFFANKTSGFQIHVKEFTIKPDNNLQKPILCTGSSLNNWKCTCRFPSARVSCERGAVVESRLAPFITFACCDHHTERQQASLLAAQRAVAVALSSPWPVLNKIIQKIIYLQIWTPMASNMLFGMTLWYLCVLRSSHRGPASLWLRDL